MSEMVFGGLPLARFIIDPPIEARSWAPHRAPILFQGDPFHVAIWVGEQGYEYTTDFVEEVRMKGASRRVAKTFPWEKLSPLSWMFFFHARAVLLNWNQWTYESIPCPYVVSGSNPTVCDQHVAGEEFCYGMLYSHANPNHDLYTRAIGDVPYEVFQPEPKAEDAEPVWMTGKFLRLPVTKVDHVRFEDGSEDGETIERIREATDVTLNVTDE